MVAFLAAVTYSCEESTELDNVTDDEIVDGGGDDNSEDNQDNDQDDDQEDLDDTTDDTDPDLFKISTVAELYEFAGAVAADSTYSAKLMANIEIPSDSTWTPIPKFYGVLKGNDCTISGLKVVGESDGQAFISYSNGATIQDLTIAGSVTNTAENTALFVGVAYNTTFTNCVAAEGSIVVGDDNNSAGIAGYVNGVTIDGCSNYATISGEKYAGGIVGYASVDAAAVIKNTDNFGDISNVSSNNAYVGGIVAHIKNGQVDGCTNQGNLSSSLGYVGGIAGYVASATISDSHSKSGCTIEGESSYVGGIVGSLSEATVSSSTNASVITSTAGIAGGIVGGAETASITSCQNLAEATVSGNSDSVAGVAGYVKDVTITSSINYAPIIGAKYVAGVAGYANASYDTIIIECENHGSITNVVNGSSFAAGIIGKIQRGKIEGCINTGQVASTSDYIGGIAGANSATAMVNCYSTADVSSDTSYGDCVGGLVGINENNSSIVNSYSIGDVEGASNVGGLVGKNASSAIVSAYCIGDVSFTSNGGGFLGYADSSTIGYGYFDSETYSGDAIGNATDVNVISMTKSQTTDGTLLGKLNAAASIYNVNNSTSTLAYNWKSASGYPTLDPDSDPTFRAVKSWEISTEAQLLEIGAPSSDYLSSDSYTITQDIPLTAPWSPIENFTGVFDGGSNTISGLEITASQENAGFFAKTTGATVKNLIIGGAVSNTSTSTGFIVGYAENSTFTSCQTTDTSSATVSNHYLGGIAGYSSGSTFSSCTNRASLTGSQYCAGIVGFADTNETKITNSTNTAAITNSDSGSSFAAGIIGKIQAGSVTNCINRGSVSSRGKYVGGIAGANSDTTLTSCTNEGEVNGAASSIFIGGVVGINENSATVSMSSNIAAVTGLQYVGGVVGHNQSQSTISQSSNSGDVYASGVEKSYAGGVAGYNGRNSSDLADSSCLIEYCYNTAPVTGRGFVAGITGSHYYSTINGSYNTGNITNTATSDDGSDGYYAAGVVGYSYGAVVANCYNLGDISTSASYSAGISAINFSSDLINCYTIGDINSSGSTAGGITAANSNSPNIDETALIQNCYSITAMTTGTIYAVGAMIGIASAEDAYFTQCYYSEEACSKTPIYSSTYTGDFEAMTNSEMAATEFLELLNSNVSAYNQDIEDGIEACTWITGTNGYPTLDFDIDM